MRATAVALCVVLTAGTLVVAAPAVAAESAPADSTPAVDPFFVDVPSSAMFFDDIQWMSSMGLSTGYPVSGGAEYRPVDAVSRQAMAAFLYRYSGETFAPPAAASFADAPVGSQFFTAIEWMKSKGITTGYADGTFHALDPVSRQAMAAFLARFAKVSLTAPGVGPFSDVPATSTFAAQIGWMKTSGISTGNADGTYHPLDPVSRQAMAAFLHRYIKRPTDTATMTYTIAPTAKEVGGAAVSRVTTTPSTRVDTNGDGIPDTADTSTDQVVLAKGTAAPAVGTGFVVTPGSPGAVSGLAGTVTAVTANSDGTTTVSMGKAALDTVFSTLQISYDGPVDLASSTSNESGGSATALTPAAVANAVAPDQQAKLDAEAQTAAADSTGPVSCKDADGKKYAFLNENNLSIGLTFENVRTHYEIRLGSLISKPFLDIYIYTEPVLTLKLKSTLKLTCTVAVPAGLTTPLPPPVTAVTLTVKPYLEFSVSGGISFSVQQRFYRMLGFYTNDDGSITTLKGGSADPVTFSASGGVTISVDAGADIELGVLGRVGLYVKVGPQLEFEGQEKTTNGGELCLSAKLSFVGSMGAYLDVWVTKWVFEFGKVAVDIATWEKCTGDADLPNHSPPTISAVSPDSIPTVGGVITITGSGLSDTGALTVGSDSAMSVVAGSDTVITATLPPEPAGIRTLTVTTPYGQATGIVTYGDDTPSGGVKFAQIAASTGYSLALSGDGRLFSWGSNEGGTLGRGKNPYSESPGVVLGAITSMAAGDDHGLAVADDGTVFAWGTNADGALGDGTTLERDYAQQVPGLSHIKSVAAGDHSLALADDGTVYGWGYNFAGEVGDGTTIDRLTPYKIPSLSGIQAIAAGRDYSVALGADGSVYTWGTNSSGQLGNGSQVNRSAPEKVAGLPAISRIFTGIDRIYAQTADGRVFGWGYNYYGELGDGTKSTQLTPVSIPNLTGVQTLAVGSFHTIELNGDGSVKAWACFNSEGELGNGTTTPSLTSVPVSGLGGIASIAAGAYHSIALTADGTIYQWGSNKQGQLGGWISSNQLSPIVVVAYTD